MGLCLILLSTGATRCYRHHRWADDPDPAKNYQTIPFDMPKGSIAFVVGTCYHGAGKAFRYRSTGTDHQLLSLNASTKSHAWHPSARMMAFPNELQIFLGSSGRTLGTSLRKIQELK